MIRRFVERDRARSLKQGVTSILLAPVSTEKASLCLERGCYVFYVSPCATKFSVKRAVEELFSTHVKAVNIVRQIGKKKRFRGIKGVRSDVKKALVVLQHGSVIDLRGEVHES